MHLAQTICMHDARILHFYILLCKAMTAKKLPMISPENTVVCVGCFVITAIGKFTVNNVDCAFTTLVLYFDYTYYENGIMHLVQGGDNLIA